MSLKIRAILVLVVGSVLGLTVSFGSHLLADWQGRATLERDVVAIDDIRLLAEVVERVRREYVEPIDDRELIAGAIRGMISELDDHSRFLGEEEYEDIRISTTGNYTGVGLDISLEAGRVTVVASLEGTPAQRAGILAGDVVVSVDDIPVDRDNVEASISRMRGRPGTEVTVDVVRDGVQDPLRFALTRSQIQVKTVRSEYLGEGYGYIRLTGFSDSTAADLEAAARNLLAADLQLRGGTGFYDQDEVKGHSAAFQAGFSWF